METGFDDRGSSLAGARFQEPAERVGVIQQLGRNAPEINQQV
jgi:hypothetical protein